MTESKASKTKIVLEGQISYPNLFEPRKATETSEAKYSASIVIPLTDAAQVAKVNAAIKAAKEQGVKTLKKWDGEVPDDLKMLTVKVFKDPNSKKLKKNPEYKGMLVVGASSKQRPGVVDKTLEEILDKDVIQAGDHVRVEVNFFPYERGSNGIGCGLNHVQFLKQAKKRWSSRGSASDAFAAFSDSDELGDDDDLLGGDDEDADDLL